jgi:alanine transaminase
MEYAVRGKVVIAADQINTVLNGDNEEEKEKYPFDHIVYTNIGNPHGVGQLPLTWPRQVMALADLPDSKGVDSKFVSKMFPKDAIARARAIKKALGGCGTGAYTHSQGPMVFRQEICDFIEERDGLEKGSANPDTIFMTNGASSGIGMMLNALIADSSM